MLLQTDDSDTHKLGGRVGLQGRMWASALKVCFTRCPTVPWLCDPVSLSSPGGMGGDSGAHLRGLSAGMKG